MSLLPPWLQFLEGSSEFKSSNLQGLGALAVLGLDLTKKMAGSVDDHILWMLMLVSGKKNGLYLVSCRQIPSFFSL
jgi:hypothetical protein